MKKPISEIVRKSLTIAILACLVTLQPKSAHADELMTELRQNANYLHCFDDMQSYYAAETGGWINALSQYCLLETFITDQSSLAINHPIGRPEYLGAENQYKAMSTQSQAVSIRRDDIFSPELAPLYNTNLRLLLDGPNPGERLTTINPNQYESSPLGGTKGLLAVLGKDVNLNEFNEIIWQFTQLYLNAGSHQDVLVELFFALEDLHNVRQKASREHHSDAGLATRTGEATALTAGTAYFVPSFVTALKRWISGDPDPGEFVQDQRLLAAPRRESTSGAGRHANQVATIQPQGSTALTTTQSPTTGTAVTVAQPAKPRTASLADRLWRKRSIGYKWAVVSGALAGAYTVANELYNRHFNPQDELISPYELLKNAQLMLACNIAAQNEVVLSQMFDVEVFREQPTLFRAIVAGQHEIEYSAGLADFILAQINLRLPGSQQLTSAMLTDLALIYHLGTAYQPELGFKVTGKTSGEGFHPLLRIKPENYGSLVNEAYKIADEVLQRNLVETPSELNLQGIAKIIYTIEQQDPWFSKLLRLVTARDQVSDRIRHLRQSARHLDKELELDENFSNERTGDHYPYLFAMTGNDPYALATTSDCLPKLNQNIIRLLSDQAENLTQVIDSHVRSLPEWQPEWMSNPIDPPRDKDYWESDGAF